VNDPEKLSMRVERGISQLLIKEVDFHKRLDDFKQNIKTVLNFTL
jgi:hypothetical protein